jgi:hypothetical protein
MPKLIHPKFPLLLGLTGLVTGAYADQTCLSESQIPSSTPTGDFTIHGDGTVTHHATGLMWMQCSLGDQSGSDCATGSAWLYRWDLALQAAADSQFAGYADWRLPNIKELRSIVEERCTDPAINAEVFPATPADYFWSSSPRTTNSNEAWMVRFNGGSCVSFWRDQWRYVRLVRSGN